MSYLIDTDVAADYLAQRAYAVTLLGNLAPSGMAMSIISYGELYEGVVWGRDRLMAQQSFDRFLAWIDIVYLDEPVMRIYAQARGQLRREGQTVGDADLLIAATAIHFGLTLVTGNRRHFDRVPNLVSLPFDRS